MAKKKTLEQKIASLTPDQQAAYFSGAYGFGSEGIQNVKAGTTAASQMEPATQITGEQAATHVGTKPLGPQDINLFPNYTPTQAPPKPNKPLPDGWEWVYDEASNTWIPTEGQGEEDKPEKPSYSPGAGFEWTWDDATQDWKATRINQQQYDNDLFALYKDTLEQFGFTGPGFESFLKQSVKEDWNESTFKIKMRQQDWYLANPLYAANLANAKSGKHRFLPEGEVLTYAQDAKRLARHYGYQEPSDAYIAMGIEGGLSAAEIEHRYQVQDRVKQFGGGVAMVFEAIMGHKPDDQDLFEIFDKEVSTKEFDDAARAAEMRGRPMLLGLGIRSAEEQKALDMLGVTADQAWAGYQQLGRSLPTVSRLAAIDQAIANDPDNPFDSFAALFADIFNPGSADANKAREEILLKMAREQARFRQSGGVQATQGQLTGLLGTAEKQTYG